MNWEAHRELRNLWYPNRFGRRSIQQGWIPYFYDGTQMYDVACPSCSQTLLRQGDDGELEVKEEYRGKLRYPDESEDEAWQDHSQVVMAVLENEPGKLN